jgi:hypothetical protein
MNDSDDVSPFRLLSYPGGRGYGLMLSEPAIEVGPAVAVLEAAGHHSNGYVWAGIARALIAKHMPDRVDAIDLDPEAGMFAARSDDAEVLTQLGRLMAGAYRDPETLRELVTGNDPEAFD